MYVRKKFYIHCFRGKEKKSNKIQNCVGFQIGYSHIRKSMFVELCSKFDVRSFEAKNRVFDYQRMNTFVSIRCWKNDVRACSMNDLVNLGKGLKVQCSMSVCSKPKFRCSRLIINRWTGSSLFDDRKMMFKFVWCLIKWCLTHH